VTYFLQQLVNGIALGSVYAMLALGVTMVWGVLNVLNFAHGQFITWGAFGAAAALKNGIPVIPSVLIGMAVAAIMAALLERVVLARLERRLNTDEFAAVVVTIGVGLVLEIAMKKITNSQEEAFPSGGFPQGNLHIGAVGIPEIQLVVLATTIVVMVALWLWLMYTRLGRSLRAVAFSREVAQLLGIDPRVVFALAFAISGALAALGGIFVVEQAQLVSYSSGDSLLILAFAAVVVGGMGSVPGALVGGLVLGIATVLLQAYTSTGLSAAIPFMLMAAVLLIRPTGIFRQAVGARA
jgi:branched-chain amino acid transport system permease protein